MAKFTFIFSLLALSLQTQLFPVEARKFTITNNCSYTVWPGSNVRISQFSLRTQDSLEFTSNNSLLLWARTNCTTSTTTGILVCQTGYCGSGDTGCNIPWATTLMEFHVIDGDFYYDVNILNGYNIPVAVVPVGSIEPRCVVTGCIYDKCPPELVLGSACQSPCGLFNNSDYCCSSAGNHKCKPNSYFKLFKEACPRAVRYPDDIALVSNTFSCSGSTNIAITFCPSSTTLISELRKPFQLSKASTVLSPAPRPPKEPPSLPLSPRPTGDSTKKKKPRFPISVVVGVPTSIAILFLLCFGTWICMKQRKARERDYAEIEEINNMESLQFDINAIRVATGNFSEDNKLGEGGFGEVYKGKLESGQEVAVKRLLQNSKQGAAEFKTEVVLVAKLQHINLVKLLGFCVTSKEKILVYELLPNSSLDRFLFDSSSNAFLDWQTRLNIIIGIARGLLYLHDDSRLKVIHRDLKTSNILLDEAMNPKISDFGLAKLFGEGQTQGDTKRIVGTYGYMAPEYAITGHYSVKSDVYSFGVMVLEIISGKKNRFFGGLQLEEALLHQAWRLWNERKPLDLVDTRLNEDFPQEEVTRCFHVGLLCIQEDAIQRPRMRLILDALTRPFISLPEPKPPRFFGDPNNLDQDHQTIPHSYSGTEMITDLYPRD